MVAGLIERLKKKVNAATVATKLAVAGGLASLVGASDADAQTLLNLSLQLYDSNNNLVTNNQIQTGQTYTAFANINIQNAVNSTIDISSLSTQLKSFFGGVANNTNVTFAYTSASPPQNVAGVPATNDLFNGSTMSTNTYGSTTSSTDTTMLQVNRTATSGFNSLSNSGTTNYNFGSFTINAGSSAAGGNLDFSFLTGGSQTAIVSGPNYGSFQTFNNSTQISFMGGSNSLSYNFTAVPEPSTYVTLAGGAALVLAAWNRRRRQEAMKKSVQYTSTSN